MNIIAGSSIVYKDSEAGPTYKLTKKVWHALNDNGILYSNGGKIGRKMVELVKVVKVGDRDFSDIIQELMNTIQGELLLTKGEDLSGLNEGLR